MKILISAYRCNPKSGGEPGRSWMWLQNYMKEGYEIVCLTNKWDQEDLQRASASLKKCQFVYLNIPEWIEKTYINTAGVYFHYLLWQKYAITRAKKLHKLNHFDLVHHISYGSPQLGSGMWQLGIPFIYGPLGGGQFPPKKYKRYFYTGWKEEVLRLWVSNCLMMFNVNAKHALRRARMVLTVNHETFALAQKYGAREVKMLLDSGLNPDKMPSQLIPVQESNQFRILWVGRLLPRKGLPLALEALAKIKDKIDLEFTIIGDGPLGKYLPQWLSTLELEENVKWLGQVPWETVKEHYQKNDVFLFCSLRESFGSQLLEAMSYGLPVVTLNHQGASAFVPDNVSIKASVTDPQKTLDELADGLLFYQKHEKVRLEHRQNAFLYARKVISQDMHDLVKSMRSAIEG